MPDYPPLSQLAPKTFGTSSFGDWLANMIGQGLTAPGRVLASKEPMTSEQMIPEAQSMMALMGSGAPAAEAGALGAVGGRLGPTIGNPRPRGTTGRPVIEAHPAEQLRMREEPGGIKIWETPTQKLVQNGFGDYRLVDRTEPWGKYGVINQNITNDEGKAMAELWEGIRADALRKQNK
jgi:hypothetical protein